MKMTPTKIAEIKRKKEVRQKKRPGRLLEPSQKEKIKKLQRPMGGLRPRKMGGGMMQMPRAMYGKGGGVCKRGMNRQAIGKNS